MNNKKLLKKKKEEPRDLPGASMAKTPQFQCRGLGFDPCVKAYMPQQRVCVPQIKIPHAAIKRKQMLQRRWKSPCAATKIWHSQINKNFLFYALRT